MIRGAGNAIVVGKDGDASMLEINGTATAALMDYVRMVRELALESAHGNRANADKISAAQSGRAMELMNQSLVWLADKLRISYGEGALVDLLRMVLVASTKIKLLGKDKQPLGDLNAKATVTLRWPQWYAPTASDLMQTATTLTTLANAQHISQETAVKTIAADFDIEDVSTELALIDADQQKKLAMTTALASAAATVQVSETN